MRLIEARIDPGEEVRTERGFRVFETVTYAPSGKVGAFADEADIKVQESSVACQGPYCWLFTDPPDPSPHLTHDQAEQLAVALLEFVRAARAGDLSEFVRAEPGVKLDWPPITLPVPGYRCRDDHNDAHVAELLNTVDKVQARAEYAEGLLYGKEESIDQLLYTLGRQGEPHWAFTVLARAFHHHLAGSQNFASITLRTPDGENLSVTVQREQGHSPAQVAAGLRTEVERLQAAIRQHRDERGDDRCWEDDERLYKTLPEGYIPPTREVAVELANCERFIQCRRHPLTEYISPQRRIEELEAEVAHLQSIITCKGFEKVHFADGREPTDNERHLLNLLSWREKEAAEAKQEAERLRGLLAQRELGEGGADVFLR